MKKQPNQYLFILSFILFAIFAAGMSITFYQNNRLAKRFNSKLKTDEPYNNRTPIHEADLSYYPQTYIYAIAPVGYQTQYLVLNKAINYYSLPDKNCKIMASTEKGKKYILISNETSNLFLAYGLKTWPTYDKEWRYAIPLQQRVNSEDELRKKNMYYVRTKDILYALKTAHATGNVFVKGLLMKKE